ncbi:hypothetical protein [Ligilactobacillus pobuzihii]
MIAFGTLVVVLSDKKDK